MTKEIPNYLQGIKGVLADKSVWDSPIANRVRERLPNVEWTEANPELVTRARTRGDQVLYLKEYKGDFLRFCPGTRAYRCCAYRIIHIGENCPLSCSYCILQAYFQDRMLKVWANQNDLFDELGKAFGADRNKRYRVGTGEFTDSLVLEPLTGYSRDLVGFLSDYPNVCLELKSKVADLTWMDAASRPDRVLPAWSLNAPQIVEAEEGAVVPLEERLTAARTCAEAGFRVCLHFDPIIRFPGWESGYGQTVDMIFDYLKPEHIAYLSMGSFRHMPLLKDVIEANHPDTTYIYDEFIPGLDNKMRLLRPLRLEQFRFMVDRLRGHGLPDEAMYYCMESDQVWRATFGFAPPDFGGLPGRLMDRAFGE